MFKSIAPTFLFSAAVFFFSPAAWSQSDSQPATVPAPDRTVVCQGLRDVPVTADVDQAMPLQVVTTLKCGQEVSSLGSDQGYTVRIQTTDGKVGYVASLYLKKIPAFRRPTLASVMLKNGVARWHEGAPGCDRFMSNGVLVESLNANGVVVQVSLHDTGWKLRANVAIANQGAESIQIEPSSFVLDEIGNDGRPLFYQDPAVLAKNVTHQVLWTESVAQPVSDSPRTVSTTASAQATTNMNYRSSFAPSVSAPNYILPHQAAEENAVRQQGKQTLNNTAEQILALALKPGTVAPNDKVSGAVWFERGKNPQQLMLRIPLGNQTLEFPLSFKQQK